jgi:hypothetical protein
LQLVPGVRLLGFRGCGANCDVTPRGSLLISLIHPRKSFDSFQNSWGMFRHPAIGRMYGRHGICSIDESNERHRKVRSRDGICDHSNTPGAGLFSARML